MPTSKPGPSGTPPLAAYLAGQDAIVAPVVTALANAIREAEPELDVAIKYGMLMYTRNADWHTWVCAIGTTNTLVCLRFLYGVLLGDPRGVLRAGTSVLKTWDFGFEARVDASAVGAYVSEAAGRYADYKRDAAEVLKASRAAAKPGGRGASTSGGSQPR